MRERLILGKQSSLLGGKTVGEFPFGIPGNIQITGVSVAQLLQYCRVAVVDFVMTLV